MLDFFLLEVLVGVPLDFVVLDGFFFPEQGGWTMYISKGEKKDELQRVRESIKGQGQGISITIIHFIQRIIHR